MTDARRDPRESAGSSALFLLVAGAGLAGACGVVLAAVAAHKVESPGLVAAANMLMVHAAALLGIGAVAQRAPRPRLWLAVGFLMLGAAGLFAASVSYHALVGEHVIAGAAPVGGSLTIVSWLALALVAVMEWARRTPPAA